MRPLEIQGAKQVGGKAQSKNAMSHSFRINTAQISPVFNSDQTGFQYEMRPLKMQGAKKVGGKAKTQ
uniref:Single-stranded DNA-binding protein n=1 Tax=Steinernema glaseri TaxID=37863 RepID=A0A1I7YTV5_9BILA